MYCLISSADFSAITKLSHDSIGVDNGATSKALVMVPCGKHPFQSVKWKVLGKANGYIANLTTMGVISHFQVFSGVVTSFPLCSA